VTANERTPGLYLRGRVWWIRYCGPRRDGSWGEIRESADTEDKRKAEKHRKDRLLGVANHRLGIRKFQGPQQERATVNELLDNLERDYETRRLKSTRQMKVHLQPVRDFFGFDRAVRVTTARIEDYIARRREDDAADATIDRETELLRAALKLANEAGLLAWLPKVPHLVKGHANAKEGFVERAHHEKLLPELPVQVLRDFAVWCYWTGMRFDSVRQLTWSGYNRETKTFRLPHRSSKNNRGVVIAMKGWPALAEVLDGRLADRRPGCDLVFHRSGRRVGEFYTTWCRALDRAELPHFTIHDYRRTAVHNMIAAGIPERVAMAISGHRTRAIFDRYNIVREDDLADAGEKRAAYETKLPR
jgi:integrase